jgi:hypothetical protein
MSESFSTLVLKSCWPINTTRDISICSPNRRNRAMHEHSSQISVLSLLDPPIQWFFLVFRTCYHNRGSFKDSFSQVFAGGSAPRPMTRSLGRAFSLDEAFSGTIDMPYVLSMLFLHISMLSFTFVMRVAAAVSLSVHVPGQHRRAFITNMQVPVPIVSINAFVWCLNQDSMTDFYEMPRFSAADRHHSSTANIVVHHFAF